MTPLEIEKMATRCHRAEARLAKLRDVIDAMDLAADDDESLVSWVLLLDEAAW